MRGYFAWIIWLGSKCHHECPCKRDVEGHYTHRRVAGGVKTEAEIGVMQLQAKDASSPYKLKEQILP